MEYKTLIIGLVGMVMNSGAVFSLDDIGSQLKGPEENREISRRILEKAGPKGEISALNEEDKGWLYETDILESIKVSESHGDSEAADRSGDLHELALFYEYKGCPTLVNKTLLEKAELDLKIALKGDEAMLGHFKEMIINKRLKDNFFSEIIKYAEKDMRNYVNGKYAQLVDLPGFQEHVKILAGAYKDSLKATLQLRMVHNCFPKCLDNEIIADILHERIKRRNNHQVGQ
ncbi:hypothetical protein [Candidatus Odyssella thessalonicensis]|uniref:hypothetical protein n=1 Tax=Candidatus Odyssella thessalonicensis TaxID=84647 RepID=UPI000225B777|nr:hypothetical protein [Candidatus Odyssella thessalonicensis]